MLTFNYRCNLRSSPSSKSSYRGPPPSAPRAPHSHTRHPFSAASTSLNTTIPPPRRGRLHVRLSDPPRKRLPTFRPSRHRPTSSSPSSTRSPSPPSHADRYRRPRPFRSRHPARPSTSAQTRGRQAHLPPLLGPPLRPLDEVFRVPQRPLSSTASSARPTPQPGPPTAARPHPSAIYGRRPTTNHRRLPPRLRPWPIPHAAAIEYFAVSRECFTSSIRSALKPAAAAVHSREFQAEERLFPELDAAKTYLKRPL